MKLTEIRIIGGVGMILPVQNAKPSDMFELVSVDGLGPSRVAVSISRNARGRGTYRNRRPDPRVLVFKVKLNAIYRNNQTYTAGELRDLVYKILCPSNSNDLVTVQFMDKDGLWTSTEGVVSAVEPNHFSADPEVSITMETLNPYLDGVSYTHNMSSVNKAFPVFTNPGDAPTGFYLTLTFKEPLTYWELKHTVTGKKMRFNWPFAAGQQLRIETRYERRFIKLIQGANVYNIIGALSPDSEWLELQDENNYYSTSSQAFDWNVMTFTPQYQGV